jgi:hypothetical protein
MPRTPPTIAAPLPRDPRVLLMAKMLNVSRADAYTAVADVWAMLAADAEGDIVKDWTLEMLDAVVEMEMAGCGTAMLKAGLVGIVDDGLVLPAELRHQQRDQRGGAAAAVDEDQGDRLERQRKAARIRQRRSRANKALTTPASKDTTVTPTAGDTTAKWTPRRLGTVEGHDVMLLYSKKTQAWFYCLKGASPQEWTASVADPENPSFAEALAGLHATMKREDDKGLGCKGDRFRPSLQALVAEAERYRADRTAAAVDDARRDEANRAAAEAAAEDQGDIDHEPAERDRHGHVTPEQRDGVTVTVSSRPESVTCPPNSRDGGDLGNAECHAPVTATAPSSSSSSLSVFVSDEDKSKSKNTTTTSSVTDAGRDHEDRILDRIIRVSQSRHDEGLRHDEDPVVAAKRTKHRQRLERIAAGLGTTVDAVEFQGRHDPGILLARCKAAGIDPNTGHHVSHGAPHEPAEARDDAEATTEASTSDKPAAGSVDARGDDGSDYDKLSKVDRLRNSCGTLLAARELGADITAKAAGIAS